MKAVILRYNAGNVLSVKNALKRIGIQAIASDDPETIYSASHVIIPGVGEASTAMKYLRERQLDQVIVSLKQPVLGICLGLQLFCSYSEENNTECLGIFPEQVKKFTNVKKVPHMGWNTIDSLKGKLFEGIVESSFVYYVHSYFAEVGQDTSATSSYPDRFSAALSKENFFAVQFHPEKSCMVGQKILENFTKL